MKRLLQFFTLLALALVGGAQTMLAETGKVVYGRAMAADDANGYTAWSANDVAASGANVWIGQFSFNETYGLYVSGSGSRLSTLTFDYSANAKQTFEIVFDNLGNTGNANNYSYLKIGNSIEIQSNQQNQNGSVIINGVSNAILNCNKKDINRGGDKWKITAVVNTATNTLEAFTLQGEGSKGANASFALSAPTSLGSSATYNTVQIGTNRAGGTPAVALTSIRILEEEQVVETANYTINYKEGETVLKTETGETAVNNVVNAISPITIDGQKYYFADGATTSFTISATEDNVLNVALRKAYEFNYTVQSNGLAATKVFATGTSVEGEKAYATYPKYINVDGTLYEAAKGDVGYYKCSFMPTADNYAHNINYNKTDIAVEYFSEAENIEGLTIFSGSNADIRCSNGMAAYNAGTEPVTITTLASGKYKLYTSVWGNEGATITFKANDVFVLAAETKGYIQDYNTDELNITEETVITVEGGSAGKGFDYVYIVRTGDATVSIDLPADYTYSTFCSTKALDFTDNADVEAYIAQVENDGVTVTLTKVNQVPAGEGVILKKTGDNTTAAVKVLASAEALSNNALVGVTEANTVSLETLAAAGNAYVLVSDEKFSKVSEGASGYISAGKAYLEYTPVAGASVNSLRISFGEPTAVADVEAKQETGDNTIYNVQGIRVSKPTAPGMYIMNGKAFIVK